jgi:SAM-dependent methyltransferase
MGRIYDATWGRAFSALYDRGLQATEEAGLREMRRELLAGAGGRVVELGAGTGANLELYPDSVAELILAEPDPHMTKRLRERVSGSGRTATILEAPAERLPLEDGSCDTAVVTLVLCTVPDPRAAIAEIARVLVPGGRLLFLEHVRSADPGLARRQDRLERPWRFFADGCHCNRDTLAAIAADNFELGEVERGELPKALPIVEPLVRGCAVLTA